MLWICRAATWKVKHGNWHLSTALDLFIDLVATVFSSFLCSNPHFSRGQHQCYSPFSRLHSLPVFWLVRSISFRGLMTPSAPPGHSWKLPYEEAAHGLSHKIRHRMLITRDKPIHTHMSAYVTDLHARRDWLVVLRGDSWLQGPAVSCFVCIVLQSCLRNDRPALTCIQAILPAVQAWASVVNKWAMSKMIGVCLQRFLCWDTHGAKGRSRPSCGLACVIGGFRPVTCQCQSISCPLCSSITFL